MITAQQQVRGVAEPGAVCGLPCITDGGMLPVAMPITKGLPLQTANPANLEGTTGLATVALSVPDGRPQSILSLRLLAKSPC